MQQIKPYRDENLKRQGYPPLAKTVLGGYEINNVSLFRPVYWDGKEWIDEIIKHTITEPVCWIYMPQIEK